MEGLCWVSDLTERPRGRLGIESQSLFASGKFNHSGNKTRLNTHVPVVLVPKRRY